MDPVMMTICHPTEISPILVRNNTVSLPPSFLMCTWNRRTRDKEVVLDSPLITPGFAEVKVRCTRYFTYLQNG